MAHIKAPWGQHLVLEFAGCPRESLIDAEHLGRWLGPLIEAINMQNFTPTTLVATRLIRGPFTIQLTKAG